MQQARSREWWNKPPATNSRDSTSRRKNRKRPSTMAAKAAFCAMRKRPEQRSAGRQEMARYETACQVSYRYPPAADLESVTRRTQRNPQKSVEKHASVSPVRSPCLNVARHWSTLDFQLPPRMTRLTSFPGLGGP